MKRLLLVTLFALVSSIASAEWPSVYQPTPSNPNVYHDLSNPNHMIVVPQVPSDDVTTPGIQYGYPNQVYPIPVYQAPRPTFIQPNFDERN